MGHLQENLFAFDFDPTDTLGDSCARCGYVPSEHALGVLSIDLWPAPGIVADEPALSELFNQDGRLNVAEDAVEWVVMCGNCLNSLREEGAEHPCVPFWVETSET